MQSEQRSLTREELYELAWSGPLSKLAPQLGLSGTGLAKILDRMDVPRPGAGHWTKKSLGKETRRPKLPPTKPGGQDSVEIQPVEVGESKIALPPAPEVVVPKRLSDPHPLVRAASDVLARMGPDKYGRLAASDVLAIRVAPDSLRRSLRLMDSVIKVLEQRGHSVVVGGERWGGGTAAVIAAQRIRFVLREVVEQIPHEPTREELAREKRYGRHWGPAYDYRSTGLLALEIDEWCSVRGLRRRWRDTVQRPLEDLLGEFVVTAEAIGEVERKKEEERERQKKIEAEERARAAAEQERLRLEAEREARLVELSRSWRTASDLRSFLAEVEQRAAGVEGVNELLAWGRCVADKLDPLSAAPEDVIATVRAE